MNAHKHVHSCALSSLKRAVFPPYKQLYHNLDCLRIVTFIRSFTVEYICPAGATHPRSKLNALLPLAS